MLLLHAMEDAWGICSPPVARLERRPLPPQLGGGLGGGAMAVQERVFEPITIPPWNSQDWIVWEGKLRGRFVEEQTGPAYMRPAKVLSRWDVEVIHPDDALLIAAARIVWNGEAGEDCPVRVWQWERRHRWWVIGLPAYMDTATIRRMMREHLARGAVGWTPSRSC